MEITLDKLPINEIGIINKIDSNKNVKRRLLDLGMVLNTDVKPLYSSPLGDPVAYLVRGSVIALRKEDTKKIYITYCGDKSV